MDFLFSHGTKGEPRTQTEIGKIPESWEVTRLGNHCYKPDYGYTESASESPDELFHAMLDELMTGQRSAVPLIDALK